MSNSKSPIQIRQVHEINVSRPRSWWYLKLQQWNKSRPLRDKWIGYLACAMLLGLLAYLLISSNWFDLAMLGMLLSLLTGCYGWAYLRSSWWRLAQRPATLVRQGNLKAAEGAFQKARKRAYRFPPDDVRRGSMLSQLASYLAGQGKLDKAKAMYEECIDICTKHARTQPTDYLTVLNNYAVFLTTIKDYAEAQETSETVVDFMPATKKGEGTKQAVAYPREELDLLFNENLAYLFIVMDQLAEAGLYLRIAESIFENLPGQRQVYYRDYFLTLRALWRCECGNYTEAWHDCDEAPDQDFFMCLAVRAKIHIARREFPEAEQLLLRDRKIARRVESLHHPGRLDHTLDLAESFFGQAKHADAFASLQEARSIVADFALPADAAWRKALETWLQRARELGKADAVASMEAELQKIPATANQGITILEKFRIHPITAE